MDLTDKARRHRMFVSCTMHALFQLLRGDPKVALEQLQRAMKFERNDSSTFVRMGACYIEMTDVRILGKKGGAGADAFSSYYFSTRPKGRVKLTVPSCDRYKAH
jgi:hypothetical protein